MNKRIVSMIKTLSIPETTYTLESLAEQFQVSKRTVRNDLNTINDCLSKYRLTPLKLGRGGEITVFQDFSKILGAVDESNFYEYHLSKEERQKIAAVLLICSPGYRTFLEIAGYLSVSRATVIHDLEPVKEYLKQENLEVHSHPNKGLLLVGTESDRRMFLLRLFGQTDDSGQAVTESQLLRRQLGMEESTKVILHKILHQQEHLHKNFLSDDSFRKILIYMEIMTVRIRSGVYLEEQLEHFHKKDAMAKDILQDMEQYCHMKIPEPEAIFLGGLLSEANYLKQKTPDGDSIKVQLVTRQFIEEVSAELGIDLNGDYDFLENLSSHLENSLSQSSDESGPNDVIQKVIDENPEVKAAVRKHLALIETYMGRRVSDTETGYLTVHVCAALERRKNQELHFHVIVACHAGIGTSYLLMEKLKHHFHFQIMDIVSAHEAGNLKEGQADLVIATVPLETCQIPHITVSPLLKDEDYLRIGSLIEKLRENQKHFRQKTRQDKTGKELMNQIAPLLYREIPDEADKLINQIGTLVMNYFQEYTSTEEMYTPSLHQLLPPSHICLDVTCKDWKQAVRESAKTLLERDYMEPRYVDAMIRNVEENGPYIVISPGFALPHEGVDQGVKKMGMSLVRLKEPVPFGAEELDPVEFVCCLCAVDQKSHLKAFLHLVSLLKEGEIKRQLQKAETPEEAAEIIQNLETQLEADNNL